MNSKSPCWGGFLAKLSASGPHRLPSFLPHSCGYLARPSSYWLNKRHQAKSLDFTMKALAPKRLRLN
jgi:hypothetical protein